MGAFSNTPQRSGGIADLLSILGAGGAQANPFAQAQNFADPNQAAIQNALQGIQGGTFDPQANIRQFFGQQGFDPSVYLQGLAQALGNQQLPDAMNPFTLSGAGGVNRAVQPMEFFNAIGGAPQATPATNPNLGVNPFIQNLLGEGARIAALNPPNTGLAKGFMGGMTGGLGAIAPTPSPFNSGGIPTGGIAAPTAQQAIAPQGGIPRPMATFAGQNSPEQKATTSMGGPFSGFPNPFKMFGF